MHKLDHNDVTDEDTLLKAQRVMLYALRDGKLNDDIFARADREAERILVEQGKLTTEQTFYFSDDDESPLIRRAELHASIAPPPSDDQMAKWREEYYMERHR